MARKTKTIAIPHSRPTIGDQEAMAVSAVIASGRIAQDVMVERFEKSFAAFCGCRYAAAVSSGTAALHLTLKAMGIGPGAAVVAPRVVCSARLNAIAAAGATPLIADIRPDCYNIDPADVAGRLTPRTRAVIAPHMFGLPVDMNGLKGLGLPVIEDAAQALGAIYEGRKVGGLGTAAIFSFYATKVITTGEGGMVVSDCRKLIDAIKDLRAYDNKRAYIVRCNFKMTDMQAAMGLVQLRRLPEFLARRREIAEAYDQRLGSLGLKPPFKTNSRIYYRYVVMCPKGVKSVINQMAASGISCARPVFFPLHRLLGLRGFTGTEKAWRSSLSLPIYPCLDDDAVNAVAGALARSL